MYKTTTMASIASHVNGVTWNPYNPSNVTLVQQADSSSQLDKKQERLNKKQERQEKKQARQLERLEKLDKSNVILSSRSMVTENATVTVTSKPDSADVSVSVGGTGGVVTVTGIDGQPRSLMVCNVQFISSASVQYRRDHTNGSYSLLNETDPRKPVWEGPYRD